MMKIALAVAAAAALLTTAPLVTPAKAQGVKMAQGVDVQVGRDRDDRYWINVYLNAKKAARPRVPRLPEGPSQVHAYHTTSPVRALVFSDQSQRSCFDEMQDR